MISYLNAKILGDLQQSLLRHNSQREGLDLHVYLHESHTQRKCIFRAIKIRQFFNFPVPFPSSQTMYQKYVKETNFNLEIRGFTLRYPTTMEPAHLKSDKQLGKYGSVLEFYE